MKRTIIKLIIIAIAAIFSMNGMAQKTVTYTFKGGVLNNIGSLFGSNMKLSLQSSGSRPAGVPDPDVQCNKPDDQNGNNHTPAGSKHDGGDFEHYDKHLLGGLSTLYVVEENEKGVVKFHNFKYEVTDIKWRRRSQFDLMTSKGGSWLEDYKGNDANSFVEYGDEGGIEADYSTNGEVFFRTRQFVKTGKYKGISTLNVKVTSKRSYQGIAIKDFDITYYTPEPLISHTDNGNGTYTVNVTVGEAQHIGAFNLSDFALDYNDSQLEITNNGGKGVVTYNSATKTINGTYVMQPKTGAQGTAVVFAKIMNNGEVAGKSSTSIKLKLSEKKGFWWERGMDWYTTNNISSVKWETGYNTGNFTPAISSYKNQLTSTNFGGQIESDATGILSPKFKERGIELSFNIDVPPYTIIKRQIKFTASAGGSGTGDTRFVEVIDFGDTPSSDTQEFYNTSKTGGAAGSYPATILYNRAAKPDKITGDSTWTFNNTKNQVNLESTTKIKYVVLRGGIVKPGTADVNLTINFSYSNPLNAYAYDYYTYITYDLNGGTTSTPMPVGQALHQSVYGDNTKIEATNGGLLSVIPTIAEGNVTTTLTPAPSDLTKTTMDDGRTVNWKFIGWLDTEDGTLYADGAKYNPCNVLGECGKGPRTLVAQWEEIPATMVATFMADGGKVGGTSNNYVQKQVTYGESNWNGESNFKAPTATKVGYNFRGYTDENDVDIFDASGNLLAAARGGKYFDASGKWNTTDDVIFYAKFELKSSSDIAAIKHTITFHPTEGTQNAALAALDHKLAVMEGSQDNNNVAGYTPTAPTNYKFAGWYTSGGELVYAADGSSVKLVSAIPEDLSTVPPTPAKLLLAAYNSTYWSDDAEWKYDGDLTLYAHWLPTTTEIAFDEGNQSSTNTATWEIDNDHKGGMDNATYDMAEYNTITVKRTLKAGKWNTVCFPCDIYKYQCDELFNKIKVLTGIEVDGENVSLKFSDSKDIVAGVPYFVHVLNNPNSDDTKDAYYSDSEGITLKQVEVSRTPTDAPATDESGNKVIMHGNFETVYHLEKGLVYVQNDKFYISGKEYNIEGTNKTVYGNLRGFRCYFEMLLQNGGGNIQDVKIYAELDDEDDSTLLENIMAEESENTNGAMYDLSGRRINNKPSHGIYILNNKKYVK